MEYLFHGQFQQQENQLKLILHFLFALVGESYLFGYFFLLLDLFVTQDFDLILVIFFYLTKSLQQIQNVFYPIKDSKIIQDELMFHIFLQKSFQYSK